MHLKKTKRNGRLYLSVVQNYRENGRTRTKTVETIGYADAYASQYPDPVAHFQEYVDELNRRAKEENPPVRLTFTHDERIETDHVAVARWGCAIALSYLDALGVREFFNARAGHKGFPPHAGRIFEMFAAERMMHVAPKRDAWLRREAFPRPCEFSLADSYEALACFDSCAKALTAHLGRTYQAIRGPYQTQSVLLVLASFTLGDTGDVRLAEIGAERARGEQLSAGIGLVIDRTSIPMSYRMTTPAPTAEEVAALVADIKREFGAKRVIAVAGSLPDAHNIAHALHESGDEFVFFRSLHASVPELREWVADSSDYVATQSGSYKVKSRNSSYAGIPAKDTVLWGREYARRARRRGDGEGTETRPGLDGFICITSSLTEASSGAIFYIYRELWRLMEPFQLLESDFSPSPYPIGHDVHLRAHFLICYASFFAVRLLRSDMGWKHNAAQVADALLRMEGAYLQENWFLFSYRNEITDAIEQAAGTEPARRLRTAAGIRRDMTAMRKHIEGDGA